jgi:amidohydrolase
VNTAESDSTLGPLFEAVSASVDQFAPQLVELRRELHQFPEVSGQEFATTQRLADALSQAGLQPQISPTERGVVCELIPDSELLPGSPGLLLRGDIDALPIEDQKKVSYCSRNPGLMHACGHDAHATIVLGATLALHGLVQNGSLLSLCRLRALFQPAEEICEGAQQMIREGVTEGIDAALAIHVDPSQPFGVLSYRHGILTAICDELIVEVRGQGGHGARPHMTRDPIATSTQLIQSAYAHVPRSMNPQWPHVLSFCEIRSGHSANVIPDHALIRGTLRTVDYDSRDRALSALKSLCQTLSVQTGCDIRLTTGIHSPAVTNDENLTELMVQAAKRLIPSDQVRAIEFPSMGGEDFAYFSAKCLTSMARLGCRPSDRDKMDLHSPDFDIDERVLAFGAKLLAMTTLLWIRQQTASA